MIWHKNMECGIGTIDSEHKELFTQVNKLLQIGDEQQAIQTLEFLTDYVVRHFAGEEKMHTLTKYPKAGAHQKLHHDFTQALVHLKKEYEDSGHNLVMLLKLNRTAVAWLQEHVLGADRDFADYHRGSCKK